MILLKELKVNGARLVRVDRSISLLSLRSSYFIAREAR